MSKDEFDTHLKFGQGILIEGFKTEDNKGLLTAKGYADINAKYETYDDILFFQNYRDAIFQIIPAGNFEINDELNKDFIAEDIKEKLRSRAKTQESQFQLNIDNKMQENVFFGSNVMFKHIDSDSYLQGTIEPSGGDNGAFAVRVSKTLSSTLIFKLEPYRSFEEDGMKIPFGSPVKIRHVKTGTYLTFENAGNTEMVQRKLSQKPIPSQDSFQIPVKKKSDNSKVYGAVLFSGGLSPNPSDIPTPWTFKLHMKDVVNEKLIQHDIGYLQHTQNQGVLIPFRNEVALKVWKTNQDSGLSCYDCLWQIEKHEGQNEYILRHLMSGMTLAFIEKEVSGIKSVVPVLSEITSCEHLGVVDMTIAKKEGGEINSDSYVHLGKDGKILSIAPKRQVPMIEQEKAEQLVESEAIVQQDFFDMVKSEQEYIREDLELSDDVPTHCFVIMEIDDETKGNVLFALSFHQRLITLIEQLKWGTVYAEKKITLKRMSDISKSLREIKAFIKSCEKDDAERQQIPPIEKRQAICKDLGMSQLLFELLYYMKINREDKIFRDSPNEIEKFDDLYNTCYEVIGVMIKNNYMFKIHVSKWIDFVIQDVIKKDDPARLNTLKELLRGNHLVVNNFIREKLIQVLAQEFQTSQQPQKYLQIFRSFCIVDGIPVTKNQTNILNIFVKNIQNTPFTFEFKIEKEKLMVNASLNKKHRWRVFSDFQKSVMEEASETWVYMVEYINLLADLCFGRNKIVKNYLEKQFELSVLIRLLQQESLKDAYVAVLRFIHYLYVEGADYYPVLRVNCIWQNPMIDRDPQINATEAPVKPWMSTMENLMLELMSKLRQIQVLKPENEEQNTKLLTVLDTVKTTIQLGFWKDMNELAEILKYCQKILANDPTIIIKDTGLVGEKATNNILLDEAYGKIRSNMQVPSKKNLEVINCKLMVTKIIELILDYELDTRIALTCQKFKQLTYPNPPAEGHDQYEDLKKAVIQNTTEGEEQSITLWVDELKKNPNPKTIYFEENIDSILLELSQYKNLELISHSLQIMKRIYDPRREGINHFYDIIFVDSDSYLQLSEYVLKRREKFYTLRDQNTLKINSLSEVNSYHNIYKEHPDEKESGIMQDLFMLSELMKNEKSISRLRDIQTLAQSGLDKYLSSDRLINLANERQTNNKLYQKIIKSSMIHREVLHYVLNCFQKPQGEISAKLLHLCFIFLTNIIANNQDNKLEVIRYMEQMKVHLPYNIGVIDFFRQLYDNNKNMLYNEREIHALTVNICDIMNELPDDSYYRSKLLDFFRCLIYFNEKALVSNQILILKIMQDDSYSRILISVTPEEVERLIKQFQEDNKETEEEPVPAVLKLSAELTYMQTFFQIMSALIEDNNMVNLGKLTKRHPFELLSACIKKSNRCWPLRRNLQMYMNKLYYVHTSLDVYFSNITEVEFDNWIYTLNCFIQIKTSSREKHIEAQTIENPVRFSYTETYLYLSIEQLLNSILELVYKQKIIDELNATVEDRVSKMDLQLAYKFLRIIQRLGCIRNYFTDKKAVYTVSLIKHIQSFMRNIIANWSDQVFEGNQGSVVTKKFQTKLQKQKTRDSLIEKIVHGQIEAIYSRENEDEWKNFPLTYQLPDKLIRKEERKHEPGKKNERLIERLKIIFTRKKKAESDHNIDMNKKLVSIVSTMKLSDTFKQYLQEEFIEVAKQFSDIDKRSETIYTIPYISRQLYISTIIELSDGNPHALSPDLKIFFLRLLTRFIAAKNENDKEGLQVDEWEAEYWDGQESNIEAEQIILKKCGVGKYLCQLLSEDNTNNIDLANEILLCAIAYLLGGYETSQKSILDYLEKEDDDNKVFVNINALIAKLGDLIYKNNKKKDSDEESNQREFSTTTIDTFDYYSKEEKAVIRKNVFEPDDAKQQEFKRLCMSTYRRSFKFIQLMCQNNNTTSKNLIREQMKDGEKKLNSIDFVQVATNQLRKMFDILCKEIIEIPGFILDFILEVTQIPVQQNQIVLMRSTFFEDLCQMDSKRDFFTKDFEEKDFEILSEIYSKCVTIILSNFEGDQPETFSSIDTKLQARFLTGILDTTMQKSGINNMQALMKHLEESKDMLFGQDISRMLDVLIIFRKIQEKIPQSKLAVRYNEYKEKDENKQRCQVINYLEGRLLKIEITNRDGHTQILYFPNHPVFASLSGQLRDNTMYEVTRETRRDKIVTLFQQYSHIKEEMEHSFKIQKQLNINEQKLYKTKMTASLLSVAIMIYMSTMYTVFVEYQEFDLSSSRFKAVVLRLLCFIQLGFSCYYAYLWYQSQVNRQNLHKNPQFMQLAVFILVSVLGTFYQPYLFSLHILDLFSMIDVLKDIFAAIAISLPPLATVSMMGVAFVMIFCSVTFSNYVRDVYEEGQEDEMCTTVSGCIMDLYVAGVISETTGAFESQRFFYDLIYITFFGLLFGNIVSGIILGAFAVLRQKKDALDDDKQNNCFICNKSRDDIEKEGDSFQNHIESNHWLWNYVFYVYVLKAKDPTDYTGIEYYISQKVKNEDVEVDWLPNAEGSGFDAASKTNELIGKLAQIKKELDDKGSELEGKVKQYNDIIVAVQ